MGVESREYFAPGLGPSCIRTCPFQILKDSFPSWVNISIGVAVVVEMFVRSSAPSLPTELLKFFVVQPCETRWLNWRISFGEKDFKGKNVYYLDSMKFTSPGPKCLLDDYEDLEAA
jgi:hypothetical protein